MAGSSQFVNWMKLKTEALLRHFPGQRAVVLHITERSSGLKYSGASFDSSRFGGYAIESISLQDAGLNWVDLILPPDLLRDEYTSSGKSILESPHLALMQDIILDRLTLDSDYVIRCTEGRLDGRPGFKPDLEKLKSRFDDRRQQFAQGALTTVHGFLRTVNGRKVFVIADGKHRIALAALLQKPEAVVLQMLASDVLKDRFFLAIYNAIEETKSSHYKINKQLVRLLRR